MENNRLEVVYNKKKAYDIVFETSFENLASELEGIGVTKANQICIVTDEHVEPLYLSFVVDACKKVCDKVISYTFPAGEDHKNLDEIRGLYEALIEEHFTRKDFLIALGGGVVGDMTGFAAATYLRGIRFVQIPTTLLAQADSSIGGKTGVDFESYKNMVGAFHMPSLVYTNVATLRSLDDRQFSAGFAEIMKHGLIKDVAFYEWLLENMYEITDHDEEVIMEMLYRSDSIKKAVVEKDPTEQGDRALLNFGHTLGHAIEKASNFTLFHGECVALGCVAAAHISYLHQLLSKDEYLEVRDMFVPFGLPISMDDLDVDMILDNVSQDKKNGENQLKFILLKKIGKAVIDTSVTRKDMETAVRELLLLDD